MGKVKQRNWLIVITVFLVIVSGIALIISVQKNLGFKTCAFDNEVYQTGDTVLNYNGQNDCMCGSDGSIICDEGSSSVIYSNFTSNNLYFSYSYLNTLEKDTPSSTFVNPVEANFANGSLTIKFERETYCTKEEVAPTQTGLYQISSSQLKLTTMTNRDYSLYTKPCKIENSFVINSLDLSLENTFQAYYQSEDGKLFNLGVCVNGARLFGNQEVFQDITTSEICTCDYGVVSCE